MMSNTILFPKYPRTQDAKIIIILCNPKNLFCHFVICHLSSQLPITQNNYIILYKIHLFFKNILYLCSGKERKGTLIWKQLF